VALAQGSSIWGETCYCIFDWILLLVMCDFGLLLCDFGLSSKYIKYLFGGSFCFGFSREFCRSSVASLDLWCSFFTLVWCGFFGVICDNLIRGNSPISLVFGLGIWNLFRIAHLNREYEFSVICYL
jgi:hypothetical protein